MPSQREEAIDAATPAQKGFIERLDATVRKQIPPFVLTGQQKWEAICNWREPNAEFVAYVAHVGPTLAAKLWRECQEVTLASRRAIFGGRNGLDKGEFTMQDIASVPQGVPYVRGDGTLWSKVDRDRHHPLTREGRLQWVATGDPMPFDSAEEVEVIVD